MRECALANTINIKLITGVCTSRECEGDLHSLYRHPKFQLISFDFHLIQMVDSDRTHPYAPPKYKPSATWESWESPCKNAIWVYLFQMANGVSDRVQCRRTSV
jgi:hypothetical protein